jgi:hypothetical protein
MTTTADAYHHTCVLYVLQKVWPSKKLWPKVSAVFFLLLQYPMSAAVLILRNRKVTEEQGGRLQQGRLQGEQPQSVTMRLAGLLQALWAFAWLSVTLLLVDFAAVFVMLASSASTATGSLEERPMARKLIMQPLQFLLDWLQTAAVQWFLPALRRLCLSNEVAGVAAVLQPNNPAVAPLTEKEGQAVWAENHMFARMPMEALFEALPQLVLQTLVYFLVWDLPSDRMSQEEFHRRSEAKSLIWYVLPRFQPYLLLFMLSVTLSAISIGKALFYIHKAGTTVGLSFMQSTMLLLQLKGTFRVPAEIINRHRSTEAAGKLTITMPPPSASLTPLQEAGFIQAKLADYARFRTLGRFQTPWTLLIDELHTIPLDILGSKPRVAAELALEQVLAGASAQQQLTGLEAVEVMRASTPDCR